MRKFSQRHVHDLFLAFGSLWFEIRVPYSASLRRIPEARSLKTPKPQGPRPQTPKSANRDFSPRKGAGCFPFQGRWQFQRFQPRGCSRATRYGRSSYFNLEVY